MSLLRLGTRGSRLALAQARWVADRLRAADPSVSVEIVEVTTSGDRIRDVPLGPHLGQAFFTKELEDALLDGRIDLAVHSCKDLATNLPEGLRLGAIPDREDPRDALVSVHGGLDALPQGARVGTSSLRRKRFLWAARPDLDLMDQRGNVPTRLKAVQDGAYDAIVLAVAGLRRLGLEEHIGAMLDVDVLIPAAAQGALAIEIRDEESIATEVVGRLDLPGARAEVTAERACLRRLEAGCQAPVGVLARASETDLRVQAGIAAPTGVVRAEVRGAAGDAEALGIRVAEDLLRTLAVPTLRGEEWAGPPPRVGSEG